MFALTQAFQETNETLAGASLCAGGVPGACDGVIFRPGEALVLLMIIGALAMAMTTFLICGTIVFVRKLRPETPTKKLVLLALLAVLLVGIAITIFVVLGTMLLSSNPDSILVSVWWRYLYVFGYYSESLSPLTGLLFFGPVMAIAMARLSQNHARLMKIIMGLSFIASLLLTVGLISFVELPTRETVLDETKRAAQRCAEKADWYKKRRMVCEF